MSNTTVGAGKLKTKEVNQSGSTMAATPEGRNTSAGGGKSSETKMRPTKLEGISKVDAYRMILATAQMVKETGHDLKIASNERGTAVWIPGYVLNEDNELVVAIGGNSV